MVIALARLNPLVEARYAEFNGLNLVLKNLVLWARIFTGNCLLITVHRLVGTGAAIRAARTVKSRALAGMCKLKSAML